MNRETALYFATLVSRAELTENRRRYVRELENFPGFKFNDKTTQEDREKFILELEEILDELVDEYRTKALK